MKNKYIFILICMLVHMINIASASEIIFESENIDILEEGNRIISNKGVARSIDHDLIIKADNFDYSKDVSILVATKKAIAKIPEKNIVINADKFIYNKNLSTLNAMGNVVVYNSTNDILINSNKILYNIKLTTLNAVGNVKIYNSTNDISIISNKIYYNIKKNKIESETQSEVKDELGNLFLSKKFIYTLNDNLIKFNNLKFIDIEKNTFQINKAFANIKSKKLIGKDISVDFNNKNFNKDNEPRLKGNSIVSKDGKTIITKGVFTTCKKNDDCPPWQLSAKEIKHDTQKKTIYYKDAWLKIYDKPVFYFPKFFHPDPTVKRQSGFLMPSFSSSSNLDSSFNLPYYHVLSNNKDFTLQPRFYTGEKLLLQSEYREVNADSKHILDLSSFYGNDESHKGHLFLNTYKKLNLSYFEESDLDIKLEQVNNDTYLKSYSMKSPIINNTTLLESSIKVAAFKEDLSLDLELNVYENLSKEKTDRFEYIFPNYNLLKEFENSDSLNGAFSFNSSGSVKNYNTNVLEKVVINDLNFKSNPKLTSKGIMNNYNFLLKNTNTDADNSLEYEASPNHDVGTLIEFNSTYPLKKITNNYENILKPKISLRYSPNNTKNISSTERRIDTNNIYSLNRISKNDTIEGGASLTYGTEFLKTNRDGRKLFNMSLANIIRASKNKNLPGNSSLGEKMSDVFGSINFSPNEIFTTGYDFARDNNLTDTNYEIFKGDIKINNFVTKFEYLNENNTLGKNSYLSNKTSFNVDDSNKFSFETRENKKTKLTEFYNLIYQYRNDCLIAAIEYNKDYYSDGDLKPSENIFFKLTIVPFGQTTSPSFIN